MANFYNEQDGIYYIDEQTTTLDSNGSGMWNGQHYFTGQAVSLEQYIISSIGNNYTGPVWISNGMFGASDDSPAGNDRTGTGFFVNGVRSTLDMYGNGSFEDHFYVLGVMSDGFTGCISYTDLIDGGMFSMYYINEEPTLLNSDGSGFWNGNFYWQGQIDNEKTDWSGFNFSYLIGYSERLDSPAASYDGADFTNKTLTNAHFGASGGDFPAANLTGSVFPSSLNGWNYGIYFINGAWTTIDSNGNGWDYQSSIYYIGGQGTTLDAGGNGFWNNKPFFNGSGSILDGADFSNQDLSTVDFSDVRSVVGANFSGATLDNIGNGHLMSGPNSTVPAYLLEGANFYGATIKNCSIDGYTQGTTYSAAYFINCDITGAYQNADFYSTRFVSCILGADFAGSNLATAEFSSNQLANGLNFAGATLAYLAIDAGNSNAINIYGNPNPYRLRPEVGFTYTGDNGNMSSGVYYFLNGEPTPLFPGGFGVWNGIVWRAGVAVPNYTGTACDYPGSNAQYWINGVETTLDCSGNGDWNGQTYVNGVVQGGNGGGTTSVLTRIAGSAKFYGKVKFSA